MVKSFSQPIPIIIQHGPARSDPLHQSLMADPLLTRLTNNTLKCDTTLDPLGRSVPLNTSSCNLQGATLYENTFLYKTCTTPRFSDIIN